MIHQLNSWASAPGCLQHDGTLIPSVLSATRKVLQGQKFGAGRPFPQTPSLLENQRDELEGRVGVETCSNELCFTCGFTEKKKRQV